MLKNTIFFPSRADLGLLLSLFILVLVYKCLMEVNLCILWKKCEKPWEHLGVWAGFCSWAQQAAEQSWCSLSSWSWPEERQCSPQSNCLEAKVGLGLHRPNAEPQKSLVWQWSPWFGSHQLQVRATGGWHVGGRNSPLPTTGHSRAWLSLAQGDGLRSEETRSSKKKLKSSIHGSCTQTDSWMGRRKKIVWILSFACLLMATSLAEQCKRILH